MRKEREKINNKWFKEATLFSSGHSTNIVCGNKPNDVTPDMVLSVDGAVIDLCRGTNWN